MDGGRAAGGGRSPGPKCPFSSSRGRDGGRLRRAGARWVRTKFRVDERLRNHRGGGGFLFRVTSSFPRAAARKDWKAGPKDSESRVVNGWRQQSGLAGGTALVLRFPATLLGSGRGFPPNARWIPPERPVGSPAAQTAEGFARGICSLL